MLRSSFNPMANVRLFLLVTLFALLGIFLYGFRSETTGTDTPRYVEHFGRVANSSVSEIIARYSNTDSIFYLALKPVVSLAGYRGGFIFIAIVIMGLFSAGIHQISRDRAPMTMLLFLTLPIFHNLNDNIIRHGMAIALLIFALGAWSKRRLLLAAIAAIFSIGMHASAVVAIAAFFAARFLSRRILLLTLLASATVAAAGFGLADLFKIPGIGNILSALVGDRFGRYLFAADGLGYRTGFRIDFFLYNLAPLLILFVRQLTFPRVTDSDCKGTVGVEEPRHLPTLASTEASGHLHYTVANLYLVLTSVFFLSFNYAYSDRLGAFSWVLVPILLFTTAPNHPFNLRHLPVSVVLTALFFAGNIFLFANSLIK